VNPDNHRNRLLAIYAAATPGVRATGRLWYTFAHLAATELALRYGYSMAVTAGVIAALSPRRRWAENLKLADDCLGGRRPRTLGSCARTACEIRNGLRLPVDQRGPKTRAFYSSIMGDTESVVVDVWMLRALGSKTKLTPARYKELSDIIRRVAAEVGERPTHFQAIVWCQIRGKSF